MYTKVTIMTVRRASDAITTVTVAVDEVVFDAIAIFYGDIDKSALNAGSKLVNNVWMMLVGRLLCYYTCRIKMQ